MKVINKSIDVLCIFYCGKQPVPRKFRLTYSNGTVRTVTVDHVRSMEHETPLGPHSIVYCCTSEVDGCLVDYEIRYHVKEMKWELYRI